MKYNLISKKIIGVINTLNFTFYKDIDGVKLALFIDHHFLHIVK